MAETMNEAWEQNRFDGLDDDPRSGRPPKLSDKEQKEAIKITTKEPRSLRQGLIEIASRIGKTISHDTLKRLLELNDYSWKRVRRSLKSFRDEKAFRQSQSELAKLRQAALAEHRDFDLWYFDQAGFTMTPCLPYAWQKVGERLELASAHGPRQNVLGFLSLHQEFHSFAFVGAIDTNTVIHWVFGNCRESPQDIVLSIASMCESFVASQIQPDPSEKTGKIFDSV